MYHSSTYGDLELQSIPLKINDYFEKTKHFGIPLQVIIGSDSQTFDTLKLVNVVAVICQGHGGIFFYEVTRLPRTNDVRQKLTTETNESLQVALQLTDVLDDPVYDELKQNMQLSIHIDAGFSNKGKTKELIPELVGWIKACGYECQCKPQSFVASTIADKLSK